MEDRRCKLGLAGRLELVRLVERGYSLRSAARAWASRRRRHIAGGIAGLRPRRSSGAPGLAFRRVDLCRELSLGALLRAGAGDPHGT